jgi:hypothetical protein
VREELSTPRGQRSLSGVGWSNSSLADAERMAREHLATHRARLIEGDERRAGGYPYSDGRPLQEEIVQRLDAADGSLLALVTRNAYGALVLNCERVLFVDLDFESFVPEHSFWSRLFGKNVSNESAALAHAERVAERMPNWGFRIYRTKAGLRVILDTLMVDARDPFWIELLESFRSDPMYVKLCQSQQSFRARITPKPWRCGIPRPALRFPYTSEHECALVLQWQHAYEQASAEYATCRLLKTVGPRSKLTNIDKVIALHDRFSLNGEQPLA